MTWEKPADHLHGLLPAYEEIPSEFKGGPSRWVQFQRDWFFHGVDSKGLRAKPDINRAAALSHLEAIQGSFEPKHEHKAAAVAYLASLWFEPDSTWVKLEKK